jgi:hypothetical protein
VDSLQHKIFDWQKIQNIISDNEAQETFFMELITITIQEDMIFAKIDFVSQDCCLRLYNKVGI